MGTGVGPVGPGDVVPFAEGDPLGVGDAVGDPLGDGDAVGDSVGEGETVDEGSGLAPGVGVGGGGPMGLCTTIAGALCAVNTRLL